MNLTNAVLSASRDSGNHAADQAARIRRGVLGWPAVLAAVQGDESRAMVLGRYRQGGFTPDDFAHSKAARMAMADALTRAEDAIEGRAGSRIAEERERIRAVRRRLERELWP